MSLSIGVDIGGTKIAAGLVSESGEIVESTRHETPATEASEIASMVAELVERLKGKHGDIVGVGVGAAGFIDAGRSTVLFSPNIDWVDEPLAQQIHEKISLPVVIENDANAAAWGEFCFGAGEDTDDLLLVTVGTGIGGGIVHDGQLFRGGFGAAGEIGHLRVVRDGIECGCGQRGCWEQYASGSALVRLAHERLGGLIADDITGPQLTKLAQDGHPGAVDVFAEAGHWLGEGIATLCSVLDPAVVAIGGGVAEAGDLLLKPAQEAFDRFLSAGEHRPHAELRLAALGNKAGLIGAADLARSAPATPTAANQ